MIKSWDLIRVFLALHRSGSYESASRMLGMDVSTVRRKIQILESNIGMALFTRDARGIVLRPDQTDLVMEAEDMEASAYKFDRFSEEHRKGGIVRITILEVFAHLLADRICEFHAANPEIIIDLSTETHFVNLEAEDVDIAVRLARPTRGTAGMRKIAKIPFGCYVSKSYLEQQKLKQSSEIDIISLSSDFSHRDHDFKFVNERRGESRNVDGNISIRVDSYSVSLKLCSMGLGLATMPCFLAKTCPDLVLYDDEIIDADLWLVTRREHKRAFRVSKAIQFLIETFSKFDQDLSSGT